MSYNDYSYKSEKYSCQHCGWTGLGDELKFGEMFNDGFEVNCPKCHERFPGLILFPTIEEALEKGTEEDKLHAKDRKAFREKWLASLLTDVEQLPDLNDDYMTFVLREVEENGENYVVLTEHGEVIWKEIRAYEYYERFIELGKLLKQKYGDRMIDLVPDVSGFYLYGDKISSINLIKNFRNKLRSNTND